MMGEVDSIPGSCRKKRDVQRETNRARNRLLSIRYDVETYINPLMRTMRCIAPTTESWPILANHRCGTWYTGETSTQACYFKSVDGHVGTWNFSLKRLNLHVVRTVAQTDGCFIMDASRTKVYPDSLSRTIPIWAAVLNRFVARVRRERALDVDDSFWDEQLYTPESISDEEHETIENLLNDRVHQLYSSGAIIHPGELIKMMIKPIRPVWIARQADSETILGELEHLVTKYFVVVCVSCSGSINGIMSIAQNNFIYSPGSADDEESWARGLTPREFWAHVDDILCTSFSCDDTDRKIDEIVAMKARGDGEPLEGSNAQELGCTGVWIGSRRAGRPPDCWDRFDAILNVTTTEYKQMNGSNDLPVGKYYLNLPVDEGKRDKNELERWLAVGIVFAMYHRTCARQVLIHCAQGRDRSCVGTGRDIHTCARFSLF